MQLRLSPYNPVKLDKMLLLAASFVSPAAWPVHFPDLNSLDLYFREYFKNMVSQLVQSFIETLNGKLIFKESCNKSPTEHEIKKFKVTVIENYTNGAALFFSSYPLTYNHA